MIAIRMKPPPRFRRMLLVLCLAGFGCAWAEKVWSKSAEKTSRARKASIQCVAAFRLMKNKAASGAKTAQIITTLPLAKPPRLHIRRKGTSRMSSCWLKQKKAKCRVLKKCRMLLKEMTEYASGMAPENG